MSRGAVGVATFVIVATLLKAAPDVGVLIVWVLGWGLIVWAARKPVQGAPNPSPEEGLIVVADESSQASGPTVTKVGDSCTIVSQPEERRNYRVEGSGATDPPGT